MIFNKLHSGLLKTVMTTVLLFSGLAVSLVVGSPSAHAWDNDFYKQTNLVSDLPGKAAVTDPNLVNPWGIVAGPKTPFWIADNGTGLSTLYNVDGSIIPLVVTIPAPKGSTDTATPTGIVFNTADANDFIVGKGKVWSPSVFIFATEDGTISGWNPKVDQTHAILAADRSAYDAVYKGLAEGQKDGRDFLYAANFHAGVVDVFDAHFHWVKSFTDPNLPAGYAPFGIRNIGGKIYVTFAKQKQPDKHDDESGPGHGFVDVFSTGGTLLKHLVAHGQLNSPWGLAVAPANFGQFSNALLVGNFGNGRINAYNRYTGKFLGTLKDGQGNALEIDGLWGLSFGNGNKAGPQNTLFFTAGTDGEQHGLFGSIVNSD